MSADTPTVRDLLADAALHGAQMIGGASGLGRHATSVSLARRCTAPVRAGAVVLLDPGPEATSLDVDLAMRYVAEGPGALLVIREGLIGDSSARVADRLDVPTVAVRTWDPWSLARTLDVLVRTPKLARAEAALGAARAVAAAGASPDAAIARLGDVLGTALTIVDPEGRSVVGEAPPRGLPRDLLGPAPRTLPSATADVQGLFIAVPIVLTGEPEAWIVAGPVEAGPLRQATLLEAMEIAAAGLAGTFARRRLVAERDARLHAALLGDLRGVPDPVPPGLAERLLAVGWRTAGWHVGIELRTVRGGGEIPRSQAQQVPELIAQQFEQPVVVPVADGWVAWVTSALEPEPADYRHFVRAVRVVVETAAEDGLVCAGLGIPRAGLRGLAHTLEEAREAALIAAASGPWPRVEAVGEHDARRLLLGSSSSATLRPYAESLLAPLLESEPELLATLELYLGLESSTASTAASLGVHRNTVTHRIRRSEELLGIGLGSADDRLALQLALRLLRA